MRIDRKLNLVVPVDGSAGRFYLHSMPISQVVFEQYFMSISQAFSAIYGAGLNVVSGPRVAAMMLRRVAMRDGTWDGQEGVENGLIREIRRLTNVAMPAPGGGWRMLPYQELVDSKGIDDEDAATAENLIVFFILVSAMQLPAMRVNTLTAMGDLWVTSTTSSNITEFINSLPTSTPGGSSGAMTAGSSVPS